MQHKIEALKAQCEKYNRDFFTILSLVADTLPPQQMPNQPDSYLVTCDSHKIQVTKGKGCHGDITISKEGAKVLLQSDWSYAASVATKHADLRKYLLTPGALNRTRSKYEAIPFTRPSWGQIPEWETGIGS